MELVLPNNYIELEQNEMMYLEGEGWIANVFSMGGGIVIGIAQAISKATAGSAIGTLTLPLIGTISLATVGAVSGFAQGFMMGTVTGYTLGRVIEKYILGWS